MDEPKARHARALLRLGLDECNTTHQNATAKSQRLQLRNAPLVRWYQQRASDAPRASLTGARWQKVAEK